MPMYLILVGALVAAVGVALFSLPAGLVLFGVEVAAVGVYLDLMTVDDDDEVAL